MQADIKIERLVTYIDCYEYIIGYYSVGHVDTDNFFKLATEELIDDLFEDIEFNLSDIKYLWSRYPTDEELEFDFSVVDQEGYEPITIIRFDQ